MSEKIARIQRPQSWRHKFIRAHDYRCHYCNRFASSVDVGPDGKPWHVDHMNALAAGGEDVEENLTLACERCNSFKGTLNYANFRRYAFEVFWVGEPKRLVMADLERLEAAFLRTTDGRWMCQEASDGSRTVAVLALEEMSESLGDALPIGEFSTVGTSSRSGGHHNLDFILQAHRLMPKLIAEIHLLHAELALFRSDSQATSEAA